jgi:hypothetical protein
MVRLNSKSLVCVNPGSFSLEETNYLYKVIKTSGIEIPELLYTLVQRVTHIKNTLVFSLITLDDYYLYHTRFNKLELMKEYDLDKDAKVLRILSVYDY